MMPKNPRYEVDYDKATNLVIIEDKITMTLKRFFPREWIKFTGSFDERTEKYPDYVHCLVWELYEKHNKHTI